MNFIGIDPSLISTAVIIGDTQSFKIINYCRESDLYNKKGLSKWYKNCEELITYKMISYNQFDNYSDGEIKKILDYNKITEMIVDDIVSNLHKDKEVQIKIEGYNFASSAGDIIDLVTFSTLLRIKLLTITDNIEIVAPLSLKQLSCKLTYQPIDIGKKKPKLVWKNKQGIAGGHFTKREVFLSIIENEVNKDYWTEHCKKMAPEILTMKSIPKPLEDVCDAFILYQSLCADWKTLS